MKQRIRDKLENLADRLQELDRLLATSEAAITTGTSVCSA